MRVMGCRLEALRMLLYKPLDRMAFELSWLYEELQGDRTLELWLDKWKTPAESTTS